jgi:transposase
MGRRRRRVKRLDPSGQRGLGFEEAETAQEPEGERAGEALGEQWFLPDDARRLRVQEQSLSQYLIECELSWVVNLRALLEAMDFGVLTRAYSPRGRMALHPRTLLGLIIYGMLKRQWSLRDLEVLAKCDAGAWLMCGGHQPDHSTIGKFIQLHSEVLSEEFFTDLLRQIVSQLKLRAGVAAVDGTVIEAASSRFGLLRAEAARVAAEQAERTAAEHAQAGELAEKARLAQAAATAAEERDARRSEAGLKGKIKVAPAEPEAVYQPRKDGVRCAAYKPSVLVEQSEYDNESGTANIQLIAGQGVHPSSEPALFNQLLDQHQAAFGCDPATALVDAGYASLKIFADSCERNLDLLCPSGRARGNEDWAKRGKQGKFGKPAFVYDPVRDLYRCPAGRELLPEQRHNTDRARRSYVRYKGVACQDCALRAQCTKSKSARTLKRYTNEELKEGMIEVMAQRGARAKYRLRGAIVERIFAEIRERQGLKRFHRRGLLAVRAEFALHCIAFNLKQAAACLRLILWGFSVRVNGSCGPQNCHLLVLVILLRGHSPADRFECIVASAGSLSTVSGQGEGIEM